MSLDCLIGDKLAVVQQTLPDRVDRLVDTMNKIGWCTGRRPAVDANVRALRDKDSALQRTLPLSLKDLLQLRDDFLALRGEQSAVPCGIDVSSIEHLRQLKNLLQLQDEVLALRSERTAVQPGVDVHSMDHVQDHLLAIRSELAGSMHNDFVVLVDIDDHSTKLEAPRPLEVLEIERSLQTDVAAIPKQMDKLRQVTTVDDASPPCAST